MYSAASPRLTIHSAIAGRLDTEGHVLRVGGAGGVVVAADAADAAGDEVGVARILALHENAVAAKDRRGAVALGDLAVGEVDLGEDAEAADDARDRIPGHFDELAGARAWASSVRIAVRVAMMRLLCVSSWSSVCGLITGGQFGTSMPPLWFLVDGAIGEHPQAADRSCRRR